MTKATHFPALVVALFLLAGCQPANEAGRADTIFFNGNIYTLDEANPRAEAVAARAGRILQVGTNEEILALKGDSTEMVDLEGQFTMPGFIEGHGHFWGIGKSLMNLNFLEAKDWTEIVAAVAEKAETAKPGEWIVGRGWHQEKWMESPSPSVRGYPYHDELSAVSPDNPVLLRHASGHSIFVNARAMELAGISAETPDPSGGEIVRDTRGRAVGVFEERAMELVVGRYQEYIAGMTADERLAYWERGMALAQRECLSNGITSFQDAGSVHSEFESAEEVAFWKEMAEKGELDLRIWAMLRHKQEELPEKVDRLPFDLPIVGVGDDFFTCRAIKSELDGALGAYGAWLLHPYHDKPGFVGQNTTPVEDMAAIAEYAIEKEMQLCVHAIGDRANHEVLDTYEAVFSKHPEKKGLRWRIEHAQHLDTADIPRFRELGVIASMQGIHCTSDAPFVAKRLGQERARYGSYPWRSLLDAGVLIANGTDAPVEDVDPITCFYASVTRRRVDNGMEFFPEQSMTREEALYSYTLGNAYAAFEEDVKGSIQAGKLADLAVLSNDLVTCPESDILDTEVRLTVVGGEIKYRRE